MSPTLADNRDANCQQPFLYFILFEAELVTYDVKQGVMDNIRILI
ncbi:unnamed protein product [Brugia timori]|uniref:Bm13125 n=2 Tax=Brugia TaxID=6278 RepID=A0A1I9G384_BRUMA|nr:Bm13125 [Brugia malayi]VDO44823.1 unnamed protein product [Brugia timori]